MIPVKGRTFLFRDETSQAIINTNQTEFELAKKRKEKALLKKQESDQMVSDINSLKEEMKDLKNILSKILEKL